MLKHDSEFSPQPENSALVLIADNNRTVRQLVCQSITDEGFRVIEAATGEECLQLYRQSQPDLVLLNAVLPVIDGFSCCQMITQLPDSQHVPVLIMTSVENEQTVDQVFEAGAADYIAQPIHETVLRQRVRRLLQANQSTRKLQAIALQQSQPYHQVQQQNADLEHQVRERTAELQRALDYEALLRRITDRVRDNLDEAHILETAVRELANGLGVHCCDTALYSSDYKTSTICYEYIRLSVPTAKGSVLQIDRLPEIYSQLLRRQYVQFCLTDRALIPNRNQKKQFAILSCPLIDEQRVFGDMWLFKSAHELFSDLEIRLVEQVSSQCAIAIRQARLYQTSQAQIAELEQLHHEKDDFLSIVSHEMRSPMSNMRLAIQMLEKLVDRVKELYALVDENNYYSKILAYLHLLRNECEREISLVNDLLDLQRVEIGYQSLNLDLINVRELITELTESFEERIHKQEQTLTVNLPDNLPFFMTDLVVLRRILSELLTNACKYTPSGEVITLCVEAIEKTKSTAPDTTHSEQDLEHLVKYSVFQFRVINAGTEISAEELPRIFDKFYRIPNRDFRHQEGTGLGLALVKKLTGYLGGCIQVESQSKRTCFTVELPAIHT